MKIDNQDFSNLSQIAPNSAKLKEFAFEKWLINPERQNTGDEYYWLHQHQLQNSVLHFNFDNQDDKTKIMEADEAPNRANKSSKKLPENKPNPFLKNLEADKYKEPSLSLESERSPLFKLISQLISPFIPQQTEHKNQQTLSALAKVESGLNKAFTHRVVFKNFQLYIEAKEAELSLNGLDLNKKQLNELSQCLKHWLLNKGINLQKLVINGVIL